MDINDIPQDNSKIFNGERKVIYARNPQPEIRQMISSILACYAWDENNPFVAKSDARLKALVEVVGKAEIGD
ncbi:oxidoreductase [Mannheimia haemolytica D153]|uniref:hypothetical protein n=1 Tax=Mannheimia haemolytica TaxID=75985 RepID=UPI00035865CC|nr:hypothetical protein [Mannheimia haemolytica]AGQ26091.1 oxidoreductase [Mannheimia haemolytica D153]